MFDVSFFLVSRKIVEWVEHGLILVNEMGDFPVGLIEPDWWLCSIEANAARRHRMPRSRAPQLTAFCREPSLENLLSRALPEHHRSSNPDFQQST